MKAKQLVEYRYKNPKGVASYTFGNYKGKTGESLSIKTSMVIQNKLPLKERRYY
tara:strand:+ start:397 stop:558 length:162 start_codon:yes stop_codon:yes gene_type:complete